MFQEIQNSTLHILFMKKKKIEIGLTSITIMLYIVFNCDGLLNNALIDIIFF